MNEAIDFSALNWVRKELGETLKQGRQFLEEYAEGGGETESLQHCMASLHEARGPLRMVRLQGADLLAMEMEEVLNDLMHGRVAEPDQALEILMQAFLRLPDYLSRLKCGQPDVPDILLPSINELRTVRESEPIQEEVLFNPELMVAMPCTAFSADRESPVSDAQAIARQQRHGFQSGLLEWYRGAGGDKGLQQMHAILVELQQASVYEKTARLWWLAAGLTEALLNNTLEASTYTRQLLGQVDRQLKQLIDNGEAAFGDLVPEVLLKDLLFSLSRANDMSGRVGEVRKTYALDGRYGEAARNVARDSITGCSAELLASVSATAIEELAEVSEQLDSFMRSGMQDNTELESVTGKLHGLANSIDIIGLEQASGILAANASRLQELLDNGRVCDESDLMAVANGMVAAQAALEELRQGNDPEAQAVPGLELEFSEGLDAVIREVVSDLASAKEQINEYLRQPQNTQALRDVPLLLKQVSGGLHLADQDEAASLIEGIDRYVAAELIEQQGMPDSDMLDTLADAICSVEFYVEELKENRLYGDMVLDVARRSVAKMGYPVTVPVNKDKLAAEPSLSVSGEDDQPFEGIAVDMPATETVKHTPLVSDLQVIAEEVDEEILEIFIEEAGEEIAALETLIPRWQSDPQDSEALQTIRRHFHTLKGSGRMVGAMSLGEFAWSLENLLNRVIDGTVLPDQDVTDLLAEARMPLAELLAQIVEGTAVASDVDMMAARAMALADGDTTAPAFAQDSEEVPAVAFEPEPIAEPASVCLDEYPVLAEEADPEIVEIFLEEAEEAVAGIASLAPCWCDATEDNATLESVRRAFHTLKGSGRMAGAMRIGEFAWVMENLLNRVADGSLAVSEDLVSLLRGISVPLGELLQQVKDGTAPQSDVGIWVMAGERLLRGEAAGLSDSGESGSSAVPGPAHRDVEAPRTTHDSGLAAEASDEATEDTDTALLEIFRRESQDHLETIAAYVDGCEQAGGACLVSDDLYRALHTMLGTAESAGVPAVSLLAGDLSTHFVSLQLAQLPVTGEDLAVLHNSGLAMAEAISRLPDTTYDERALAALRTAISGLPQPAARVVDVTETAESETHAKDADITEAVQADLSGQLPVGDEAVPAVVETESAATEPFADMDLELLEIFVEEAGEIIDNSANTLRDWSQAAEHRELLDEFQRQLHTLKGGARMVGIGAIGDLSHSVESLLTRVVDGHVETSHRLFDLLQDAHDRLADMLEQVRDNRMPEPLAELEAELDRLGFEKDSVADTVEAIAESEVAETEIAETEAVDTETAEALDAGSGVDEQRITAAVVSKAKHDEPEAAAYVIRDLAEVGDTGTKPVAETQVRQPAKQPATADIGLVEEADNSAAPPAVVAMPDSQPLPPVQEGEIMPRRLERRKDSRVRGEQVRVQSELLDNLVNYAGEINIYRSRMEQQLSVYRFNLAELDQTINRLRDQLRKMEIETETQILFRHEQESGDRNVDFDPLELDRYSNLQQLSRSLIESISDLHSIQEMLDSTTRESETLLLQQSRVSTDLQEGLLRTRMIPFASLAPRLRRIVRQSASELGKKVELRLDGADGEMDRTVIERIVAPLEHMLRNAVAHGLEKTPVRKKAGKPAVGTITIAFRREGPEIVLQVSDDGQGMNLEAIRTRAIERGMMQPDAGLPDGEVMQFILQTGFSTASEVTQLAGRGVGMDVVNSEVKQLGGSLHIDSKSGTGSVFTIRLPYTLAINQALLVRAGEETFCIPLGGVESVVRVDREELADCYAAEKPVYEYAGNRYQLKHLGSILRTGDPDMETDTSRMPVLLVRVGETRVALQVEALVGNREIVVKPLGAQLSSVTGVSGATILGDGSVVMILDLPAIVRLSAKRGKPHVEPARKERNRLLVMVVDDSITVRKVTTRLLERQGFEVLTAKDGIDAMGLMQDRLPDMMLLDIEMPRMDGFELASHMRNDERLRHIPITMITSRTGDKHRKRASQIGIDHYLGKPYQEHELLETINRLVGLPDAVSAAG